jgi:SAM-dependent MidA family methyltransferase
MTGLQFVTHALARETVGDQNGVVTEAIRAAIAAAGGAIPFREFQRLALYGPGGFYTRAVPGRAGRRGGQFITSPEVGPLFGAVIARFLDAQWEELGRPDPFTVVDAGAGPGTLARAVLAAGPRCGASMRYVAVEVSAAQREMHPRGIESRAQLPDEPFDGVILANELLDNLPFRLCVFDDGWREAFVVERPDGTNAEVLSTPLDPLPAALPLLADHGARAPLQEEAAAWLATARARLRSGRLVVIDYARVTTEELADRPWREWLRTYRDHERGGHYLAAAGGQDITTEVALDQLPPADTVRTQAQFLQRWGIDELVDEGLRAWWASAAAPDLAALVMRSRAVEAAALLDPAGLGSFAVVEWAAA